MPIECNDLEQVRAQIDRLDALIVELIAERTTYVIQAAKFKKTKVNNYNDTINSKYTDKVVDLSSIESQRKLFA